VNPKDGSDIGHPSRDPKLFKQIHLTRHPILRTFDLGSGKGSPSADLTIIEDQVESVCVIKGVIDSMVELGGGQGAEEGEVGVDLVVLVGELDVVFPARRSETSASAKGASKDSKEEESD
jgi:hypothetical protein